MTILKMCANISPIFRSELLLRFIGKVLVTVHYLGGQMLQAGLEFDMHVLTSQIAINDVFFSVLLIQYQKDSKAINSQFYDILI